MGRTPTPWNSTTTYTYTARRQIQTITPPAGGATSFTYNTVDDQVTRTDGNGRIWTAAYDASRLVTSVTDPLGNIVCYTYDANGNRLTTTDAKNLVNRDRPTTITDPLNGQTRYAYDAVSNMSPELAPSTEIRLGDRARRHLPCSLSGGDGDGLISCTPLPRQGATVLAGVEVVSSLALRALHLDPGCGSSQEAATRGRTGTGTQKTQIP